jgi:hypothetical protein
MQETRHDTKTAWRESRPVLPAVSLHALSGPEHATDTG